MTTIKQFVRSYGIKAHAELVDSNPNMPEWTDANHFKVKLTRRGRQMTLYFSQGYAHSGEPQADSILECLQMDVCALDQDFEDWAGDFGYDLDSRKAERTYKATRALAEKLQRFLGSGGVEELRNCEA